MSKKATRIVTAVFSGGVSEINRLAGVTAGQNIKGPLGNLITGGTKFATDPLQAPNNLVKAGGRLFALPKMPENPSQGITAVAAPTDSDAAKRAMDAADQERRRKLVADPNITGSLGLTESASVRRSVLG